MQDEIKDCGVACLQMIIKYYGGHVRKNTLTDMTKTNKEGTTAYHLKETLINLGFEAKGIRCDLKDIGNIELPCIANVIIDKSYKHFIVIYEINFEKKYLIIGDPADKVKKISFEQFNKIFNKVLITCYPIKNLPIEKDISLFKFVKDLITPCKKILISIFILSIFITILSIFTSFYTEYMINGVNLLSKKYLFIIFYTFFLIYLLKIILDYFRNKLLALINQKLDLALTLDIYNKIIKLPYYYYKNRTTGDVISRINDLDNVREMISKVSLSLFIDLPLTIISLVVLLLINKILFLIGLAILILYFLIIVLFKGLFNNYIRKIQMKKGETNSYMVESISGFETIKGTHLEDSIINKFDSKYRKFINDIFKFQKVYFKQNLLKDIINNIGFIFITFIGCILVLKNKLSLGELFTFTSLLLYFLEPIKNIIDLDNIIKEAKNSLRRVLDIVTYKKDDIGTLESFENGDIEFKNINYTYNDRDYILKNINLNIKKNSKVMVVGKSGSGKSTLFKILMKYYDIDNNHVFINNIDLNKYKVDTINNNILYISQNEILFNDTLYNNLIFDGSNSKNLNIVKNICCLDEIMDKNLKFNMLIEENGFNLSGGEKQRIILARNLLKPFNTLIIDEGLSQVDVDLERKILKKLFKKYKDKTIIMISHRLDNLDLFDNLVKIEKGGVKNVYKNG